MHGVITVGLNDIAATLFPDGPEEAIAGEFSPTAKDGLQHLQGGLPLLLVEAEAELDQSLGCPVVAKSVLYGGSQHRHLR